MVVARTEVLNRVVQELDLERIKLLDNLNHAEPVIYLCGKSSTGKTTYLNALFNFEKNTLYTSTDISTLTEFRFRFGEQNAYFKNGDKPSPLHSDLSERRRLFSELNREGDKYIIQLSSPALEGRTIVDIPGVFDFKDNNEFAEQMLDEADVVYFFNPCLSSISSQEVGLLQRISQAGIAIVVLFTMGDITEPSEGITRKTLPDFVANKILTQLPGIQIKHHCIVSSNDYYKNKDSHGLNDVQNHIVAKGNEYKETSEENRLAKAIWFYDKIVSETINELEKDFGDLENLIRRENELWFESVKRDKNLIKINREREFSGDIDNVVNFIYQNVFGNEVTKIISFSDTPSNYESFLQNWNTTWEWLNEKYDDLHLVRPELPKVSDSVFKKIQVNGDKMTEILKRFSHKNAEKGQHNEKNKEEKSLISFEDIFELGFSMDNALVLWDKYIFHNKCKDLLNKVSSGGISQIQSNHLSILESFEEQKQEKINESLMHNPTIDKLKVYKAMAEELKGIHYAL